MSEVEVRVNTQVREYLAKHGAGGDVSAVGDEESLLGAGVIDSVAMVDLIAFLEGEYGIVVDEDDMVPEHFDSIAAIAGYVSRQLAQRD